MAHSPLSVNGSKPPPVPRYEVVRRLYQCECSHVTEIAVNGPDSWTCAGCGKHKRYDP